MSVYNKTQRSFLRPKRESLNFGYGILRKWKSEIIIVIKIIYKLAILRRNYF